MLEGRAQREAGYVSVCSSPSSPSLKMVGWLAGMSANIACDDRDELITMVETVVDELPEDDST